MKHLKIHFAFLLLCLLFFSPGSAQVPDSSGVYLMATVMPSYQGGEEALYRFINQNVSYPKEAIDQKKQGTVQVRAVVDETGLVSGAKVVRGICPSLDAEAVRVVTATSGKWISGKIDDKPVKVYKYLRVSFKIDTTISTPAEASAPVQPLKFIGGDSAFYSFIKTHVQVPNTVLLHPQMMIPVNVLVTFSSYNQISEVMAGMGSYQTLNDEAIRLLKLSQGKWVRSDINKTAGEVKMLVTVPFGKEMIDTNSYNKSLSENIITVAYRTNSVFARAYDSYNNDSYEVAIIDLNDCISNKKNQDAALVIRAYCYLSMENWSAGCQDLVTLRSIKGMDSEIENLYFKYCADPNTILHRRSLPGR